MKPLNPIMAVLAIASVGVFPLRALAADGSKPAGVVISDAETSAVDALAKILKENPAARVDAGKRISEFVLEEFSLQSSPDKKSFVAPGADAETRRLIGVVAGEWGAKQGDPADVAVLYFVIGPGAAAPSWAPATFKPGMQWLGKVRFLLSDPAEGDWAGKSRIGGTTYKDQVTAFLNASVGKSWSALDPRTKGETVTSVEGNNNTGVNPPDTTRAPRTGLGGPAQQYTLNDLYVNGAKVGNVHGAKDEHSRTLSLKIYSKWVDGVIVNEVGVFDVTDSPKDIFGQRFSLDGGDKSFILDDRTPGHKKYTLKFGKPDANGNQTITLSRPGDGGTPLVSSVKELFEFRAKQAADMNNIVKVGAEEFYVLPQGGARSALALFSKKLIDGGSEDPTLLEPTLFAEVGKRGPNGRNQNLPGKPHLGKVGKEQFHLEFNEDLGLWEVKEGAGDPPEPPATPTTGDGSGPGGGNPGGGTPGPVPAGGYSFSEFVRTFLAADIASGKCKINPDDMKDLAPSLRDKYGIVSCTDEREGPHAIIIVPKTAATPDQQLKYGSIAAVEAKPGNPNADPPVPATPASPAYKFVRVRFFDHYLVLQFDKQVQYLDLLKQGKDGNGFALAGFVAERNASKFTEASAFVDALKNYMGTGVPPAALTEVPRRIQVTLGNKPYYVAGGFADGVLTVNVQSGGDSFNVWPEITRPGAAPDATPNPYSSLSGPANVMDGSVSSVPEAFKPEFDTADKRKAKLIGDLKDAEAKGIALYEAEDPIAKDKDKKFYLTFRYKAKDPAEASAEAKVFQMKPFEVFNSTSPHPGPSLVLQGLADGPVVDDRVASGYKFIPGSTKARGALAVFQNKQVSAANAKKGAANCVGPVLWWGLSGRPAALKACEEDKF